jgi:hypothetical protein
MEKKKIQKIFGACFLELLFANTRQSVKVGAVAVHEKRPNKSHFLSSGKIQFQFQFPARSLLCFLRLYEKSFSQRKILTLLSNK